MSTRRRAVTDATLHPLLDRRWSTRAFDPGHELTRAQLDTLLEAARWAPSASNSQPWRFAVGLRGTAEHATVLDTLAGGNRVWAHAASALIVVAVRATGDDGGPLPWAQYDAGQAAAHLTVQAEHEGLAVHQMGGFDAARLAAALGGDVVPLVVVAVGRHSPQARLPEPFAERETAPRERLPVSSLLVPVQPSVAEPAA